ncbi:MAG: YgdI/YgdR family lipoprotein [Methanophagales archaeon]|nr:YgdI/YgdR family lipoprotein [Methanophagales archaeon]
MNKRYITICLLGLLLVTTFGCVTSPKVVGTINTVTGTYTITKDMGFTSYDVEYGLLLKTITLRRDDGSTRVINNVTGYNLRYER